MLKSLNKSDYFGKTAQIKALTAVFFIVMSHNVPAKCRDEAVARHGHLALVVWRFIIFSRATEAERHFLSFRFSIINLPLNI